MHKFRNLACGRLVRDANVVNAYSSMNKIVSVPEAERLIFGCQKYNVKCQLSLCTSIRQLASYIYLSSYTS